MNYLDRCLGFALIYIIKLTRFLKLWQLTQVNKTIQKILCIILSSRKFVFPPPVVHNLKPPRKLAVRELINQYLNDFVAFGLPLFYNQRPPDHKSGMITVQKTPITSDYDAFAPKILGLSQPRTQFLGFAKNSSTIFVLFQ